MAALTISVLCIQVSSVWTDNALMQIVTCIIQSWSHFCHTLVIQPEGLVE